jgi:Ca-activated chloride channel family protein
MRATRWVLGVSLLSTMCVALGQSHVGVDLVYVHAAVATNNGSERPITGISRESFKLSEDNKEQEIAYLSADTSLSAGIVLDGSRAWKDLVKTVVPPVLMNNQRSGDEVFFSDSQDLPNEGLYQAANRLIREARNPMRFLVLFTDRYDPGSYSYSKLRDLMRDQEFELYVVTVPPPARSNQISTPDMTALQDLTALSGGKVFSLISSRDLENLSHKIAVDWRNQYRIGYLPTNSVANGKWRSIKVAVEFRDPKTNKVIKTKVRTKSGYYAPVARTK